MTRKKWQLLKRKTVYSSPFLKVFEDKVRLPSGKIIEDYTVVEKSDVVMIVATDKDNNLIAETEYKYAVNKFLFNLPAGHMNEGEDPITAATRELLEETGFGKGIFKQIGILHEYPTKDTHRVYVIRAKNVEKIQKPKLEDTEESIKIILIQLTDVKKEVFKRKYHASTVLSALVLAGLLKENKEGELHI